MTSFRSFASIKSDLTERLAAKSPEERLIELTDEMVSVTFELELLKRKYEKIADILRMRDILLDRYGSCTYDLIPTNATLEARESIDVSDGFYSLEYDQAGFDFRWTGPGSQSKFEVWVKRSLPIFCRIDVLPGGDARNEREMSISVDGINYPLVALPTADNIYIAGPMLPRDEGIRPTVFIWNIPYSFVPKENDGRVLGVRFRSLQVKAIEESNNDPFLAQALGSL